jgi:hypothetical protein
MDYLVYVEFNAENLQFYLWYEDYKRRFMELSAWERALSPEWIPEVKEAPDLVKSLEKEERRKRDISVGNSTKGIIVFSDRALGSPPARNPSVLGRTMPSVAPSTIALSNAEVAAQASLKWQPCKSA